MVSFSRFVLPFLSEEPLSFILSGALHWPLPMSGQPQPSDPWGLIPCLASAVRTHTRQTLIPPNKPFSEGELAGFVLLVARPAQLPAHCGDRVLGIFMQNSWFFCLEPAQGFLIPKKQRCPWWLPLNYFLQTEAMFCNDHFLYFRPI